MSPKGRVRRSNNRTIYSLVPEFAYRYQSMRAIEIVFTDGGCRREKPRLLGQKCLSRAPSGFVSFEERSHARFLLLFHPLWNRKRAPIFVYTRLRAETRAVLNSGRSLGQEQSLRTDFAFYLSFLRFSILEAVESPFSRLLRLSRTRSFKI